MKELMQAGLYEQLINKVIATKLDGLNRTTFYIKEQSFDKHEAIRILTQYLVSTIHLALKLIEGENAVENR